MTKRLRIFIYMKYLIITLLTFTFQLTTYSQNIKIDTTFNENGTIKQTGQVSFNSKGEKDGVWLIYDHNSKLRAKMFYENGIRKGKWEVYDEHGHLISSKNYSKSN